MAVEPELMIVGERQGLILGPGTGRPQTECRLLRVSHQISIPRIPSTGMTTSKRHHKPLSLRREVSVASIGIRQAFASMENLTEVRVSCYQVTPLGVPKLAYTIQLFDAHVSGLRMVQPNARTAARNGTLALNEEVSFTYLGVEWTWHHPHLSASDEWLIAR